MGWDGMGWDWALLLRARVGGENNSRWDGYNGKFNALNRGYAAGRVALCSGWNGCGLELAPSDWLVLAGDAGDAGGGGTGGEEAGTRVRG